MDVEEHGAHAEGVGPEIFWMSALNWWERMGPAEWRTGPCPQVEVTDRSGEPPARRRERFKACLAGGIQQGQAARHVVIEEISVIVAVVEGTQQGGLNRWV